MPRIALAAPLLSLSLLVGCEDAPSKPKPPRDSPAVSGRLAAGGEAVVQAYDGGAAKLKGFADEAANPGGAQDPSGRGTLANGTRVVVADDSMQDLFHNIPGSRDVAVKLKDGGLGGRAVFVARHDLRPALGAAPSPK